ncbi:hypothetical protein [Gordoniibacillus kamchatkensis]|uniref:hypothetical protein n=1 Tax=Gordoniibacillus kamchatkensis TaxID=1590651 RepID=UPI000A59B077|nr:hypothetical protein [Paenibacillus sp. VKM B-2647]
MKGYLGIGLFVVIGLLAAFIVGFYNQLSAGPVAIDDDKPVSAETSSSNSVIR